MPGMRLFSHDITQEYLQSDNPLPRTVCIRTPPYMVLYEDMVLRVVNPLYGIPESGLHWYLTYTEHHTERQGMKRTTSDPCIMYNRIEGNLRVIV